MLVGQQECTFDIDECCGKMTIYGNLETKILLALKHHFHPVHIYHSPNWKIHIGTIRSTQCKAVF